VVWRRTLAKRMRAKLHAIKQALRLKMHEPVAEVGVWLKRVVDPSVPISVRHFQWI
jgi:RNA-directed DNA polymerase